MTDIDSLFPEIQNTNRQAFTRLVIAMGETLKAFAFDILKNKETAEDIVQDVFVNLWVNRHRLKPDTSLKKLLYTSTHNLSLNHLRSRKRENERYKQLYEETLAHADTYVIQEEALRLLEEAIEHLPPRTAEVIKLRLSGLKQEEIARQMNVTVANVKRLQAIGIAKLKQLLGPLAYFVLSVIKLG